MSASLVPFQTEKARRLTPEAHFVGTLHGQTAARDTKDFRETRQEEKPWHRLAARCLAQGMNNMETAGVCEVNPNSITMLLKNDWFQERIEEAMAEGSRDVMQRINRERFQAIEVLCNIRDDPTAPKAVRANICFDLLDRALGKAKQSIEVSGSPSSSDPAAEVQRLEEEQRQLMAQ